MKRDHRSISLSVNLNKIALIRNSRPGNNPDLLAYSKITHCRCQWSHRPPSPRSATYSTRRLLSNKSHALRRRLITTVTTQSLNLTLRAIHLPSFVSHQDDFNNYPGFIEMLAKAKPDQATLVPDSDSQLTSDHGFDLTGETTALEKIIAKIHQLVCKGQFVYGSRS